MEDVNLKHLWDKHSGNLQSDLNLDYDSFKNANFKNTRLQLNRLVIRRSLESLVFIIAVAFLMNFIVKNIAEPQYVISGVTLCIFSIVGAIGSLWQIVLIFRLDYAKPVINFLMQLEKLKIYSLQTLRLLLLSIPFYFAYIIVGFKVLIGFDIFSNSNSDWLIWNAVLSALFVPLSIYLVTQLRVTAKRNWVNKLMADNGGKQIDAAIQFINEIVGYRNEAS